METGLPGNDDGKRIWVDREDRFYLIPDDVTVSEGDFKIRSLFEKSKKVDEGGLKGYSSAREEAQARIRGRASGFVDLLKNAVVEAALPARGEGEARPHVAQLKTELHGIAEALQQGISRLIAAIPFAAVGVIAPEAGGTRAATEDAAEAQGQSEGAVATHAVRRGTGETVAEVLRERDEARERPEGGEG